MIKASPISHVFSYYACSGSTIVGVGSPDPPQFVYEDDEYKDVFVSGKSSHRTSSTQSS